MSSYTVRRKLHIRSGGREMRRVRRGASPKRPPERTQRISKLMALAIHFDDMVAQGQMEDYATIARFGGVSRARVTQIVNLTLLAPDIQEEILFLPKTSGNRDAVSTRALQPLAREPDWRRQREMWARLKAQLPPAALCGTAGKEVAP